MKLEISDKLKEVLKEYYNLNYDDFEVVHVLKHENFVFILKNKNNIHIRICFSYDQIFSIKILDSLHIPNDFLTSTGKDCILFFYTFEKIFIIRNCKLIHELPIIQKDCVINETSLVFLKLSNFEQLKTEINKEGLIWKLN